MELRPLSSPGQIVNVISFQALRALACDYADVLLYGLWNKSIPPRVLEAGLGLKASGLVRHLAVSGHQRKVLAGMMREPALDIVHLRYNAAHRGAEVDIFPEASGAMRPGLVAYTATSWSQLMDPKRTPKGERTPTAGDCYRFVLSNPNVDLCMSGTASVAETRHALDAMERGPLSEEEMAWMRRVGDRARGRAS